MKKTMIAVAVIALVVVVVLASQAVASGLGPPPRPLPTFPPITPVCTPTPTCSDVCIETFEGCFDAQDYPDGYSGNLLEEIYPGIRHVSVTISASGFNVYGDDLVTLNFKDCAGVTSSIDMDSQWPSPNYTTETFEFNTDNWHIFLITTKDSIAKYSYAVTVTYPSNQW